MTKDCQTTLKAQCQVFWLTNLLLKMKTRGSVFSDIY